MKIKKIIQEDLIPSTRVLIQSTHHNKIKINKFLQKMIKIPILLYY